VSSNIEDHATVHRVLREMGNAERHLAEIEAVPRPEKH
jgi:hypothetical protein